MGTPPWETREGPHSFADEMRIKKHQSFSNWIIGKDLQKKKKKKCIELGKKATEKVKGPQKNKTCNYKRGRSSLATKYRCTPDSN